MYILIDENDVIVASSVNMPDISDCSGKGLKVFEIPNSEYTPELIGKKLEDFDIVGNSIK